MEIANIPSFSWAQTVYPKIKDITTLNLNIKSIANGKKPRNSWLCDLVRELWLITK